MATPAWYHSSPQILLRASILSLSLSLSSLGILAVPLPIEQRRELARLLLVDTVVQTLERLLVPAGRLTVQEH